MNAACPSKEELQRLLADQLGQAEEDALESHVVSCEACQRRLEELTGFADAIPSVIAVENGSDARLPRPGGALVRLANASIPVLSVVVEGNETKSDSWTQSMRRRLGGWSSLLASGRFLRRQVWTWPLIGALLLGSAGWWVHRSVESAMRQQRVDGLTTILDADVAALRQWMDNQRATAELVAADETLQTMVQELLALSDSTQEARSRLARAPAQAAIRHRLIEPLRRGGYTGFLLICPSGIALAADEDAPVGAAVSGYRRDFFARVSGGEAAVSKPFLNPLLQTDSHGELRAGQPCMYAAAAVRDEEGRPIAALGLAIRPDDQFTRILRVARTGRTGETYAFDRKGVLLSQSRFDDHLKQIGLLVDREDSRSILNVELRDPGVNMVEGERPSTPRRDQPLTLMAAAAVQGDSGYDVDGYRDYRGVPVVGAWQWLDDYDYGIATEIDQDEAFAPAYILRRAFTVLMGLLAAAAAMVFLAMLLMARQQRRWRRLPRPSRSLGSTRWWKSSVQAAWEPSTRHSTPCCGGRLRSSFSIQRRSPIRQSLASSGRCSSPADCRIPTPSRFTIMAARTRESSTMRWSIWKVSTWMSW